MQILQLPCLSLIYTKNSKQPLGRLHILWYKKKTVGQKCNNKTKEWSMQTLKGESQ